MLLAWLTVFGCDDRCVDFDASCRPSKLATFEVVKSDRSRSEVAGGHVMLAQVDDVRTISFAAVIDGEGRHVWWHQPPADQRVLRARPAGDGRTVTLGVRHPDNRELAGAFLSLSRETGELLDELPVSDNHHEHVELPDGRIVYLSRERIDDEWFDTGGPLAADTVRVVDWDGTDELLLDVRVDFGIEPYWTCLHMSPRGFVRGTLDWSHANSLVYDADTETLTFGIRHFDAAVRFDLDGRDQWWLGNPLGGFAAFGGLGSAGARINPLVLEPEAGTVLPRHAHFSDVDGERLVVFDNGNHTSRASRIVEYAVDADERTVREVWSYVDPAGRQFGARGDAIRLPGGNVLITWSAIGELWEVTRDGDIVWRARTEQKVLRSLFLEDW